MIDPMCENCGYECDAEDLNKKTGFCHDCQNAYNFGFDRGRDPNWKESK